ncbi:hypothetical protein RYX36_026960 [Vicia faba]
MIRGWSQTDNPIEAIHTYNLMYRQGLIGSNLTYPFLLKTCARISHVFCTRMVHARVLKLGFESVLIVSNTLIHVYAGFGELGFVCRVFDETSERDLVSWNYLIYGYGRCKRYREVLGVFEAMRMANVVTMVKVVLACSVLGVRPNHGTFGGVLLACANAGVNTHETHETHEIPARSFSASVGHPHCLHPFQQQFRSINSFQYTYNELPLSSSSYATISGILEVKRFASISVIIIRYHQFFTTQMLIPL